MNLTNKKGVDISYANGNIDLNKVKAAGYDFAMIRCGYGSDIRSQDDAQFENNVKKAEAIGMPWGVYLYSYAVNTEQARSEVEHVKRLLKGKKPTMPIALDVEDTAWYQKHGCFNRSALSSIVSTFIKGVKAAGFYPMIYTGYYEIRDYLSKDVVNSCDIWLAEWGRYPDYNASNLGMWQYGGETNLIESNSIPGVGVIDKDECYKDYPTIIKNGGYNGWTDGSGKADDTDGSAQGSEGAASKGSSSIKAVQSWLNKNYSAKLTEDGIYGPLTKAALVKALQTELNKQFGAGLAVDGIYGSKTASKAVTLSKGDHGNITKTLQGFLICNGYSTNGFDGIFSNGTESAVKSYQRAHGLTVDGIVGANTWLSLAG